MFPRKYAVLIVAGGRILKVAQRCLSLREAIGYTRSFNGWDDGRVALIVRHPISRAISRARSKSRSS